MVQHELPDFTPVRPGSPMRTCVGCRKCELAVDLLRVVVVESGPKGHILAPDLRRRLPGRGAWLHPDPGCLSLAERRRAFGRALRVSGNLDTSAIDQLVDRSIGSPADASTPSTHSAVPLEKNRHNTHEHTVKHQR